MANGYQEVAMLASEALIHMEDALVIGNLCTVDKTADYNSVGGYKVGDTVNIKTRPEYVANDFTVGTPAAVQEIRSSARPMKIEHHFDVTIQLGAKEKALDFEGFVNEVIIPATYKLAEKCETYIGTKILNASGLYTSTGLFTTAADMALSRSAANIQQLNKGNRFCIVDNTLESTLLGAAYFGTWTNRGDDGARVFREGDMGHAMGMDFYSSLQFPTGVLGNAGTLGVGVGVTNNNSGANNKVGVKTLTTTAITGTGGFPAGTRLIVAGMRRPMIVATVAAVGDTTIALKDPISEIVPDAAAITTVGSGKTAATARGAIFDDQSIGLAMPILDKPSDKPSFVVSNNGYSVRVVTGYDMLTKTETMSLDCLIGAEAYDPRRITLLAQVT